MKKLYFPIFATLVSVFIATFMWDKIVLPYDINNEIYGEYSINKFNPNNDTLRFIFFVSFPLIIFILSYSLFCRDEVFSLKQVLFQKEIKLSYEKENLSDFNIVTSLFILILILEFLCQDFTRFFGYIDIFHDGDLLTPSSNAYLTNYFWLSSTVERGLYGNFGTLFLWKIFSTKSIGLLYLSNIFLLLLNKVLLIFISREISRNLLFNEKIKLFYFILLSLLSIALVSYYDVSAFPDRMFLFLLFFLFFSKILRHTGKFLFFLLGLFSAPSLLWFIDVGAFINVLLFFLIFYYIIRSEHKKSFSILFGVIFSWLILIILIPDKEFNEFVVNTLHIYSTMDYHNGLIYPAPFLSGETRATRALLLIILAGLFVITINFNKSINLTYNNKVIFIFIFLSSLLTFKTALSRSDTPHIQSAIGFNLFEIYAISLYFLFFILDKKNKIKILFSKLNLTFNKNYKKIFLMFVFLNLIIFNTNIMSLKNLPNSINGIKALIYADDKKYLSSDYQDLIKYYKKLVNGDPCVQTLTNELAIPYLLEKPTCTQFYLKQLVVTEKMMKKFIDQLDKTKPKIILYNSEINSYEFSNKHAPIVFEYIDNNYSLHSKFKFWTFYSRN